MRRYVFRLAMLSLALLGPSMARANDLAAGDQEIAQQIVQQLKAEKKAGGLKGFSIDLSVEEGTVWLSGRVANEDQQAKALDIARRIPGVKQVVDDLDVTAPAASLASPRNVFANMTNAVQRAMNRQITREENLQQAGGEESGAIGSGVQHAFTQPVVQAAPPVAATPLAATPSYYGTPTPQTFAHPQQAYAQPQQAYAQATPVYAGSRSQVPLAFAAAQQAAYNVGPPVGLGAGPGAGAGAGIAADGYSSGGPVPMHLPGSGIGMAPARYDHPHMPGYAWPSYAAYPNYAAVTYPKQYSPTAWPYIGPFYPYPQVPLGWRKVTLEWDDGWWMLDFKDRRTMYNH
jgi:hypothetical protein